MDTFITTAMLIVFFAIMVGIGIYCRKHSTDVGGFVLGGRSIGPWLTAFAFGTSYFSAVIFVGYAGQFGWNFGLASTWIGLGNAFIGSLLAWVVLGRRTRVTPATILVPYSSICLVWNIAVLPVIPCTITFVSLFKIILIFAILLILKRSSLPL